jgi:c-di-GMP-binding flagellar brake protein YcgR
MSSSPFPQRREAFRVGLPDKAIVQRAFGETASFELRDLSVAGARLVGASRLELDEPVTITLGLHDDEVQVTAVVVRLDTRGCGVRFGPLTPAVENRIGRFLAEEQRRRVRTRD